MDCVTPRKHRFFEKNDENPTDTNIYDILKKHR